MELDSSLHAFMSIERRLQPITNTGGHMAFGFQATKLRILNNPFLFCPCIFHSQFFLHVVSVIYPAAAAKASSSGKAHCRDDSRGKPKITSFVKQGWDSGNELIGAYWTAWTRWAEILADSQTVSPFSPK